MKYIYEDPLDRPYRRHTGTVLGPNRDQTKIPRNVPAARVFVPGLRAVPATLTIVPRGRVVPLESQAVPTVPGAPGDVE